MNSSNVTVPSWLPEVPSNLRRNSVKTCFSDFLPALTSGCSLAHYKFFKSFMSKTPEWSASSSLKHLSTIAFLRAFNGSFNVLINSSHEIILSLFSSNNLKIAATSVFSSGIWHLFRAASNSASESYPDPSASMTLNENASLSSEPALALNLFLILWINSWPT